MFYLCNTADHIYCTNFFGLPYYF